MEEITQIVVPEVPKVISNEQLYVYIPIANGDNPGIVVYDSNDFTITNGVLTIKHPADSKIGVVVIENSTGTLTSAEFNNLITNNYLLKYGTSLYIKNGSTETCFIFSKVVSISNSNGVLLLTTDYFMINNATRDYNRFVTQHQTYSKTKIDDLIQNVAIPVDSELSNSSTNPVQNKVITDAIDSINLKISSGASNVIANNGEEVTEELNTLMINDKNYGVPKPVKYLQTLPDPTPDSPELVNLMNTDATDALYRKQGYFQGFDGSNLANTTWILAKKHYTLSAKEINFTCDQYPGITFKEIWPGVQNDIADFGYRLYYTNTSGGTSIVDTYESITITIYSGADIRNSFLLDFINKYGTFVPELQYKYTKIQDELTFKTINGESIIGEGNIIIQGGGGSELLWTNPDRYNDSGFVAQTITIQDCSNYNNLLIYMVTWGPNGAEVPTAILIQNMYDRSNLSVNLTKAENGVVGQRSIKFNASSTSIKFENANYGTNQTQDNRWCVPIQIYGVNL